ncbi:NACHT domain-containing protein [Streptomyces sp. S3(2020)]|uniref:NACHT domain-containing protein n=1 Tax=Streptomyces sp. S3(2020) TaxID=2732044 RepID=UPI00148840C6|nr:NACHT domain-containing protein [Streptomyces sp. S3(2020)]NNN37072.1 NACHT domain-containing protein [Streptomyces sp. S3(2020)]
MFFEGRRQRRARWWGLVVASAVVTGAALVWIANAYEDGLDSGELRSVLVQVVIAVLALGAGVLALRPQAGGEPDLATVTAWLARAVEKRESGQWRQLLGGDRVFIDVGFTFDTAGDRRTATVSDTPRLRLASVVEDFLAMAPRRLLVTGAPGAGKTVLATRLVLELVSRRAPDEPVPVRLPLAEWDPDAGIDEWIARQLTRDYYDLTHTLARELVDARLILPVCDGLDEMEERAPAALDLLDAWTRGSAAAPMVVTCRSERYAELAEAGHRLLDAARIEVSPVTPEEAREYLADRTARRSDAWRVLLAELRDEPDGVTGRTLSTPWLLSLAAIVYGTAGAPARLLLCVTRQEAADLLLGQYVRVAIGLTSDTPAGYTPRSVHRWLRSLAVRLEGRTDLVPGPWLVPVQRFARVRAADMAVTGVLTAAVVIAVLPALRHSPSPALLYAPSGVLSRADVAFHNGVFGLLLCALGWWRATRPLLDSPSAPPPLHRLRRAQVRGILAIEYRNPERVVPLVLWAVLWTALGVLGVLRAPSDRSVVEATVICACGIAYSLIVDPVLDTLAGRGRATHLVPVFVSPRDVLPAGWMLGVLISLGWLPTLLAGDIRAAPVLIALALWTCSGSSSRYLLALLLSRGRVPFRFAGFLRWAHEVGLLRVSGPAYQFRHREFQEWLVRHPEPVPDMD